MKKTYSIIAMRCAKIRLDARIAEIAQAYKQSYTRNRDTRWATSLWLAVACFMLPMVSSSQDVLWERSYGGKHADYLFDAVPTADYGFILAGSSLSGKTGNKTSANNGNLDYCIWKMDEKGEQIWQKSFGGSGIDLLSKVICCNDGGFLLAGTSDSPRGGDKTENTYGGRDFWVIKLDAGGGTQWQKSFGGFGDDELRAAVESGGGFLLGGTSSSGKSGNKTQASNGSSDFWLVAIDLSGNIKWQRDYGGQSAEDLRALCALPDGSVVAAGISNSRASFDKKGDGFGGNDFWILKLGKEGDIDWQQTYGGALDDQLRAMIAAKEGGFLVGGHSNSPAGFNKEASSRGGSDFWLLRLDADGNSVWQQTFDFGKYDLMTSIVEDSDGAYLIGGTAKGEAYSGKDKEGTNDYILFKASDTGKELWRRTFGSDGEDIMHAIIPTRDQGFILAGISDPEAVKKARRKKSSAISPVDKGKNLAIANNAQQKMDGYVNDARESANDYYKEQTGKAANAINNAIGQKDSPLKVGVNAPGDLLQQGSGSGGSGAAAANRDAGPAKKLPASRQKSNNFGRSDFWVVKLRDKEKKEKARQSVEAFPNPSSGYTNVVIGYEFDKGTATVFDISGRMIQSFAISDRTVPVNLSGLPEGIYIVNIRTNKSDDSVKVMKTGN